MTDSNSGQWPGQDGSDFEGPQQGGWQNSNQPYPGPPYGQQPYPNQPYPNQPHPQQPYGQQPYPNQPHPQQPYGQQPYPGQPYPGPPYGQQPYPNQAYPQQPYGQQPYGQQPYPAPHPGPYPLPGRPQKPLPKKSTRSSRRPGKFWVLVGGITALALALGIGVIVKTGSTPAANVGPNQYAAVYSRVDLKREFNFPLKPGIDPAAAEGSINVYLDPQLTTKAPDAIVMSSLDGKSVQVSPGSRIDAETTGGERVRINSAGKWGLADAYYIAQTMDLETGQALPKPKVTMFTVTGDLSAPMASFTTDDNGFANFTWSPVKGATDYAIVSIANSTDMVLQNTKVTVIGRTSDTKWTTASPEQIQGIAEGKTVSSQNDILKQYEQSQDEQHAPSTFGQNPPGSNPRVFGVVAIGKNIQSPVGMVDTTSLNNSVPITSAKNAISEINAASQQGAPAPTSVPITVASGATVNWPLTYDVATVTDLGGGKFSVRARADRTAIGFNISLSAQDAASASAQAEAINQAAHAGTSATGQRVSFEYSEKAITEEKPSTKLPKVPYPIVATNPLSEFIATNMVAGNHALSLASYLPKGSYYTTSGIDLNDAIEEATGQNPYALGYWETSYDDERQILYVRSVEYEKSADLAAAQKALNDRVNQVVAAVIPANATDVQKVTALNQWLKDNAAYDYDALALSKDINSSVFYVKPRAWTAEGILLDGLGVCDSYARAFSALAMSAGVTEYRVTGDTPGGLHAWNIVKVDNQWLYVDVTWNDTSGPDKYLMIPGAQLAADHTVGTSWLVDSQIPGIAN